jgi:acetate kinase
VTAVLVLNAGSSSLKLSLLGEDDRPIARGAVERIGLPDALMSLHDAAGVALVEERGELRGHQEAVSWGLAALERWGAPRPAAAGHRVVHGGAEHAAPALVDGALLAQLRELAYLAPLHLPGEIAVIEAIAERYPGLPQVVCFDTAFHRRMPEIAQRFPLPEDLWRDGVRRYGFHGLSYEHVLASVAQARRGRVVIAHLGNGASLAAVRDGAPVDTTMGLTPAGGIMMGTRPGDLDPGVAVHLLRRRGLDADGLERLVTRESGLLGVSGLSPDMRTLLEARASDPCADLAVSMFCYRARKEIGALAAALGGLDLLVFTGGIGERAAPVRAEICAGLAHLGVRLDPGRNAAGETVVSAPGSAVEVRVVRAAEELVIARSVRDLLARRTA